MLAAISGSMSNSIRDAAKEATNLLVPIKMFKASLHMFPEMCMMSTVKVSARSTYPKPVEGVAPKTPEVIAYAAANC
jgi:hypothetical protein